MLTFIIIFFLFLLGAAAGSFLSVLIYRIHAQKKGILGGRSQCPDCEKELSPLDLIPIASYLALRGKCRYCNKDISYMYPGLEILTGGLFAALFLKFPFLDSQLIFSSGLLGLYLLHAYFLAVLVFTFFFDLRYIKVSDEVVLPGIFIGLLATLVLPGTLGVKDALLGAAIPLAFFALQIIVSRGAWLGQGDLRVGAFMGVILGWKLVLVALFLAYLIGSAASIFIIIKRKQWRGIKIPFAPFLATGTVIAMFFGESIVNWYLRGMSF